MENKKLDGGPAFPCDGITTYKGVSVRDYFAAKAMQSLLTLDLETTKTLSNPNGRNIWEWISSDAYKIANAMLEAREK